MQNQQLRDWSFVSVDLELTNRCEHRCALCPREALSRPVGTMTREVFHRLAPVLGSRGSLVSLSGMGDPLRHPDVFRFCTALRGHGADVRMVVNPASLRDAGTLRDLVECRPNSVLLSFPSSRKAVFEQICPALSFEDALEAARTLIALARGKVGVRVSGVRTALNREEAGDFVRFWDSLGARAGMADCHGRGGKLPPSALYVPAARGSRREGCGLFAFHTFVTWEGEVLACCHDLSGETALGSLVDQGFETMAARKACLLEEGRGFDLCRSCDEPLRSCTLPNGPAPRDRRARRRFFKKLSASSRQLSVCRGERPRG
ncbi:MAG: radical SAM/SPASM domain-containing protein [bacterium]